VKKSKGVLTVLTNGSIQMNDDVILKCPNCLVWSDESRWGWEEAPCETCGSHVVHTCPNCDYTYDIAYDDKLETKKATKD
jgi:hypothetical protein